MHSAGSAGIRPLRRVLWNMRTGVDCCLLEGIQGILVAPSNAMSAFCRLSPPPLSSTFTAVKVS